LNPPNGNQPPQLPKENPHLIDLEWTVEVEHKLNTLVGRYTSRGVSEAWRIYRLLLACFLLVLEDTQNHNNFSVYWSNEWPLDKWVDK
jgi:hypothetical protein